MPTSTLRLLSIRCAITALSCGLVGGCVSSRVAVKPILGVMPEKILLVPTVGPGVDPLVLRAFDDSLRPALRQRGYTSIPVDVASRMLEGLGWTRDQPLNTLPIQALRDRYDAEALMTTSATLLSGQGYADGAMDVEWILWDAALGRRLWQASASGSPQQSGRELLTGPIGLTDPFFSDEPVRDEGSWTTSGVRETPTSFAERFQRQMARQLPLRQR